jgi:hypothetical protein
LIVAGSNRSGFFTGASAVEIGATPAIAGAGTEAGVGFGVTETTGGREAEHRTKSSAKIASSKRIATTSQEREREEDMKEARKEGRQTHPPKRKHPRLGDRKERRGDGRGARGI